MKRIILFAFIILSTTSSFAQHYKIIGKFTGFKDGTKFYLQDSELEIFIDSARIQNNRIVFEGQLKEHTPKLLFIFSFEDKKTDFVWCNLFVGNERVLITGDKKDFPFFLKKTGSKYQDTYNKLLNKTRRLDSAFYYTHLRLNKLVFAKKPRKEKIARVKNKLDSISDIISHHTERFISNNLNSYTALMKLYFGRKHYLKSAIQKLYNNLKEKYKKSFYGQRILNYLKMGNLVQVGDQYVDYTGIDQNGQSKSLSEFIGEKYVLVDFMQSYCVPCIKAERSLKEIYNEYAEQISIVSICLDKVKEEWKRGLKRDNPHWPRLWNGNGPYGKVPLKYGATGTPTFVLINPQGKIIAKWTGYKKNRIEKKLQNYLHLESI